MSKNKNILVINNKHYDAKTGHLLSGGAKSEPVEKPQSVAVKLVAKTVKSGRKPASHAAAHAPKASQTLMRRAVRKPSASLKRRIRVQPNLGSHAEQPNIPGPAPIHAAAGHRRPAAHKPKSQLISHFSASWATPPTPVTATKPAPVIRPATHTTTAIHQKPQSTAELLEYALQQANSHQQQPPQKQHRKLFKRRAHAHSL